MGLVSLKELLDKASSGGYAVPAFNVNNLETVQAAFQAAQLERSPVILQATEKAGEYAGFDLLFAMVHKAAESALGGPVPAALHLDHGGSVEVVLKAIRNSFTSVMIDGSHLDFNKNIELTRRVVEVARPVGVSVEAELGRLGGIEDGVAGEVQLTDPEAAGRFVKETGVDALAVAIGTSHGAYKFRGEPRLRTDLVKRIKDLVNIPLVLHGASSVEKEIVDMAELYGARLKGAKGIPLESIREAIKNGINKINIDTDLRLAFTASIRKVLTESPEEFDPRKILGPARELMVQTMRNKMKVFGSSGKALF
ncbi:MAG TPA: class II fructose-1,6-bisphosphate aldolase [Candidatus Brocadiales bacterium]|nr:class II fructose-1,6-bisphosphate aldolase [Candidatus Brocadiales bacterium]